MSRTVQISRAPAVFAFGGTAAMDVAHELFHRDSRNILDCLAWPNMRGPGTPDLGRRELTILLCSVLLRGAGQDWFEQGDVWARVLQHSPPEHKASPAPRLHLLRPAGGDGDLDRRLVEVPRGGRVGRGTSTSIVGRLEVS